MRRTFAVLLLLLAAPLAKAVAVQGPGQVVEPVLQATVQLLAPDDGVNVIITLADGVPLGPLAVSGDPIARPLERAMLIQTLRSRAAFNQRALRAILQDAGVHAVHDLWLINALAATVPSQLVEVLAALPAVAAIKLDRTLVPPVVQPAVAPTLVEWNLDAVRAPELWTLGYTGQDVVVANMDTGIDGAHPDLASRWRGGTNSWFDPYGEHPTPADTTGHGTQTMGVMVGGDAGGSAIGVAPDAQWIAAKIFNDQDLALTSAIHLAFQWLLDPDGDPLSDDAPDIVNNSWGFIDSAGQCINEFQTDIDVLRAAGITVVFAAGNAGPGVLTSLSPANNAGVVSVGAVDDTLAVASFSSRGPSACDGSVFPHLAAPGVQITTADLSFGGLPLYATVTGTSFAAPHVAGVMALVLSGLPGLGEAELTAAVVQSAADLAPSGPDNDSGYGLVDAVQAYALARCPAGGADSDGDVILDACDNCTQVANPDQRDTDADGFGNLCDADFNNNGVTDPFDFQTLKAAFGSTTNPDQDLNGNGIVDPADFSLLKSLFGQPPGPSGLVP